MAGWGRWPLRRNRGLQRPSLAVPCHDGIFRPARHDPPVHQCGQQVPELLGIGLFEYREIIERPYRLVFRIVDQEVVILAILDSRRDLGELLIQRAIEG